MPSFPKFKNARVTFAPSFPKFKQLRVTFAPSFPKFKNLRVTFEPEFLFGLPEAVTWAGRRTYYSRPARSSFFLPFGAFSLAFPLLLSLGAGVHVGLRALQLDPFSIDSPHACTHAVEDFSCPVL